MRYGLQNAPKKRLGRLGTTREIRGWKKPSIKPITYAHRVAAASRLVSSARGWRKYGAAVTQLQAVCSIDNSNWWSSHGN